jgi:hypothetical protein
MMMRYVQMRASQIPSDVRFDTWRPSAGQMVEVEYGGYGAGARGPGDPYRRVTDHSDGSVVVYRRDDDAGFDVGDRVMYEGRYVDIVSIGEPYVREVLSPGAVMPTPMTVRDVVYDSGDGVQRQTWYHLMAANASDTNAKPVPQRL